MVIYGRDSGSVAEQYAKEYNSNGEHKLVDNPQIIDIEGEDGFKRKYKIFCEPSFDYFVDRIGG